MGCVSYRSNVVMLIILPTGIHAIFFWFCAKSVWKRTTCDPIRQRLLLAFVIALFLMGTLYFTSNWAITQQDFVENRLYAGGPFLHYSTHFGRAGVRIANMAYSLATILADGTMVCPFVDLAVIWP
jgi:hypothetical protein